MELYSLEISSSCAMASANRVGCAAVAAGWYIYRVDTKDQAF